MALVGGINPIASPLAERSLFGKTDYTTAIVVILKSVVILGWSCHKRMLRSLFFFFLESCFSERLAKTERLGNESMKEKVSCLHLETTLN